MHPEFNSGILLGGLLLTLGIFLLPLLNVGKLIIFLNSTKSNCIAIKFIIFAIQKNYI